MRSRGRRRLVEIVLGTIAVGGAGAVDHDGGRSRDAAGPQRRRQRPAGARSGRGPDPRQGADRPARRAAARGHATGEVRARISSRARCRRPRARGVGRQRPVVQHDRDRPPGHLGRLQGVSLRRPAGPRVRVLRHGAAVSDQRHQRRRTVARRRGARHERSVASGPDRHADRAADDDAARVAEPQHRRVACWRRSTATQPPSPGWSRSTTCTPTAGTPCSTRPRSWRASATRAGSRPTARPSTRRAPRCRRSPRST